MTPAERKIVYEACERLETTLIEFSCCALTNRAADKQDSEFRWSIRHRYASFYQRSARAGAKWKGMKDADNDSRILMLLLFAEAENDVV